MGDNLLATGEVYIGKINNKSIQTENSNKDNLEIPFSPLKSIDLSTDGITLTIGSIEVEKSKVELPERYIINKNATILFWKDGSKTVVKKVKDDEFNPRLGFLTAFFQHYCGMSKNKANKFLANLEIEEDKNTKEEK